MRWKSALLVPFFINIFSCTGVEDTETAPQVIKSPPYSPEENSENFILYEEYVEGDLATMKRASRSFLESIIEIDLELELYLRRVDCRKYNKNSDPNEYCWVSERSDHYDRSYINLLEPMRWNLMNYLGETNYISIHYAQKWSCPENTASGLAKDHDDNYERCSPFSVYLNRSSGHKIVFSPASRVH